MTDLNALIERLEKASGPDRVLDALIECELRKLKAYEIGMSDKVRSHWRPDGTKGEVIDHQGYVRYHAPDYSFSPTAAMTLIPSGAAVAREGLLARRASIQSPREFHGRQRDALDRPADSDGQPDRSNLTGRRMTNEHSASESSS